MDCGIHRTIFSTGPLILVLTSAVVQMIQHRKGESFCYFVGTDPSALAFACLILLVFSLPSIAFAFVAKALLGERQGFLTDAERMLVVAGGLLGLLASSAWNYYEFWSHPGIAGDYVAFAPWLLILPGVAGVVFGCMVGLLITLLSRAFRLRCGGP